MELELFENKGICVKDKTVFSVDSASRKDQVNILTHAHSDHVKVRKNSSHLMSKATHDLIRQGIPEADIQEIPFHKKIQLNEFTISLHPSGHILGGSQIKIENHSTAVISSDFKLQESILFKPAEILPCDVLLLESTYGLPCYEFPERQKVYEGMSKWLKQNLRQNHFLVFGGYATGKAQELTKFVNQFSNEVPLVSDKVFEQNNVYEKHGVRLGDYWKMNGNFRSSSVLILPPHLISQDLIHSISLMSKKKVSVAIATGWQNRNFGCKVFPLSDHADFNHLMEYVRVSQPKMVLTHHGFASELARHITRKLRIPARELSSAGQKTMAEFAF